MNDQLRSAQGGSSYSRKSSWPLLIAVLGVVVPSLVIAGFYFLTPKQQSGEIDSIPGIQVLGEGVSQAEPDQVKIAIGVRTSAPEPHDAASQNSIKASTVVSALKGTGLDDEDVQTINVSLQPDFDFRFEGEPNITGYTATNTVRITTAEIARLGELIDLAIASGANEVQGIEFSLSTAKEQAVKDEARKAAAEDAHRRATIQAQLNGVRLGDPVSITEQDFSPGPPIAFAESFDVAATTPIEPGSLDISIQVDITYAIN